METRRRPWLLILVAAGAFPASARGQDEVSPLLKYLPDDTNAVAVLKVKELIESPRGKQEGWAAKAEAEFLAGAAAVPPWVKVLLRGIHAKPGARDESHSVAVASSSQLIHMAMVASREHATVEQLAGLTAVASPRNCYFVQLGPQLLGAVSPGFRQDVARWVAFAKTNDRPRISDYLQQAVLDPESHIVMALDLEYMLDPRRLRERVEASAALNGKPQEFDATAKLLYALEGIRFTARVGEATSAAIRLDFKQDVGAEGQYVKPLLLEFLGDMGAALEDFDAAEVKVERRSVTLSTQLSDPGLRQITSLIIAPHPHSTGAAATATAPTPEPPRPAVPEKSESLKYYLAVNRTLDDLERALRRAKNYNQTALWHENFAKKIDQLPTAGVDKDLLDYGASVSSNLKGLAASLRGVPVTVNTLQNAVVYEQTTYVDPWLQSYSLWGGYRGGTYTTTSSPNLAAVREKQAEAVLQGSKQREEIWTMLNSERDTMHRSMVGRYGPDFEKAARRSG